MDAGDCLDLLCAVLGNAQTVERIDLYFDHQASFVQFDPGQAEKKQAADYDDDQRLVQDSGMFCGTDHEICPF